MSKIDLPLKHLNDTENVTCNLTDAINKHNLIVILGAPGSGKTSILQKYQEENSSKTKFYNAKDFIKLDLDKNIDETIEVLLLDGLDEFRSTETDKAFVVKQLAHKISNLKHLTIVISCREMDWYGETDSKALQDEIKQDVGLYRVLPMQYSEQLQLAYSLKISNPEVFIEQFQSFGFLDNPQMFYMLSQIYQKKDEIKTKADLYRSYIKYAREHNKTHIINKINDIEIDDMVKYTGYIAFYYMFCGIEELNDTFVDEILSNENGYSKNNIEKVLATKLFSDKRFSHRTIAEFALANFLNQQLLKNGKELIAPRLLSLFVKKDRIPTELRGTFAWLCSLSGEKEFIMYDPYYQAIHGDNTLFNNELKQTIILAVKEYAKSNPWFYSFGQSMQLEGFYHEALDDLLMQEFDEATRLKNHYQFFIVNIITSAKKVSEKIKKFCKNKIFLDHIREDIKREILILFKNDISFLQEILQQIKEGNILDKDDGLKEELLSVLYPEHISLENISTYISLYGDRIMGHCYYLYETKDEDKFQLVDNLYKSNYNEKRDPKLILNDNITSFIHDYFLETLLKYPHNLSAQKIYEIIKYFKAYHNWYEHLEFKSYRYDLTDNLDKTESVMIDLANELFSLYIDDVLLTKNDDSEKYKLWNFDYFFNYKMPNKQSEILFSKMNLELNKEMNLELFIEALRYLPKDEDKKVIETPQINEIIEKFGFKEEFLKWNNPQKSKWQIESEKREKEKREKDEKIKNDNEIYFSKKNDEDIQKSFGDLHYLAQRLYLKDEGYKEIYLTHTTFERLKNILRNAIYSDLIDPSLLTIQSLVENSYEARRNIDMVYYISCCLNSEFQEIGNKEFLKYLYIVDLAHHNIGNVYKSTFSEYLKTNDEDFAQDTLKEYIKLLIEKYCSNSQNIIFPYIKNVENIDELEYLANIVLIDGITVADALINNFLNVFNFSISLTDLTELLKITLNDKNTVLVSSMKIFAEDRIENFTINMAIAFFSIFKYKIERFKNLNSDLKIKIVDYMICQFNTEESLESFNGIQSPKNMAASFLERSVLDLLELDELKSLKEKHTDSNDIWFYKITHKINEKGQVEADNAHRQYTIKQIKSFILESKILSKEDFFTVICIRLEKLKTEIEDNRNNDKKAFYSQDNTPKDEENCRDEILRRLNDKYPDINLIKEKYEGDNRADLHIKYKENPSYEIQIECKKDANTKIYNGIKVQLIDKYLSSEVQFGIYLIFYFNEKKNKDKKIFLDKVYKSRPVGCENRIKIICIDLTL